MNQHLTASRALTALIARRTIHTATVIAATAACIGIIITLVLVHFFSPWWWLLALSILTLTVVFFIVRNIVLLIIRKIHPADLTKEQQLAMNTFIDNVQTTIDTGSMSTSLIVFICLKDIVLHRDIVTIKKLIQDTAGLKSEYEKIQKLF